MKDLRKQYKNQEIRVNGNVVNFDGKGDPTTKVLKIYRMYGDVTLFDEAVQEFCIEMGYDKAVMDNHN